MTKKLPTVSILLALVVTAYLLWGPETQRGKADGKASGEGAPDHRAAFDGGVGDGRAVELSRIDPSRWIDIHLPGRVSPGFNLTLFRRRLPMLLDMNGSLVHSWPNARAVGRARLSSRGELTLISVKNTLQRYDWDGELQWEFALERARDFPHHDFALLANGHVLLVVRSGEDETDYLLEVDDDGSVVWAWYLRDQLEEHFQGLELDGRDKTHVNSVQELPPNPWHEAGDQRFRPGNILLSARNLNTVMIVDRSSGEIVWKHTVGLDYQHEAMMIPPGRPAAGHILIFNNGRNDLFEYRRSSIVQLDPLTRAVTWSYGPELFYSSTGGIQQDLPNGNLLITSSQGGRVFEIDRDGEVVWQWSPPYLPMRTIRYPVRHCRQLEAITSSPPVAVEPDGVSPYVDVDLYSFAIDDEVVLKTIYGKQRQLLQESSDCRRILVPPAATLTLEFGLDPKTPTPADVTPARARFTAVVKPDGQSEAETIMERRVRSGSGQTWKRHTVSLRELAFQWVELCLDATVTGGGASPPRLLWQNPRVRSGHRRSLADEKRASTPEERRLAEKQLEALGYVN